MFTVDEALQLVLTHTTRKPGARVPVAEAVGLVIAEDVASDVDSPPHDKSMVDGYAVVANDLASGAAELTVLEEVTAGAVPTLRVTPGACTRIMTGAPIPDGADAVVMIERSESLNSDGLENRPTRRPPAPPGGKVRLTDTVRPGQNIIRRGDSLRSGEVVLKAGHEIRPAEVGLLCEVGRTHVEVFSPVSLAILATGNELVDASARPGPGQIRNSNGPMLAAAVRRAGATPIELGVARDEPESLRQLIRQGLAADILVLSGGVSAGVLDLVPSVLKDLGVEQVFHKIRLKPGKPLWFGVAKKTSPRTPSESRTLNPEPLVFGVPGNPVSSLVCFELFVRPAIEKLMGGKDPEPLRVLPARLANEFNHRGDRPTYFPAVVRREGRELLADLVRWRGSADIRGLTLANALAIFAAGDRLWPAGEPIDVLLL